MEGLSEFVASPRTVPSRQQTITLVGVSAEYIAQRPMTIASLIACSILQTSDVVHMKGVQGGASRLTVLEIGVLVLW